MLKIIVLLMLVCCSGQASPVWFDERRPSYAGSCALQPHIRSDVQTVYNCAAVLIGRITGLARPSVPCVQKPKKNAYKPKLMYTFPRTGVILQG